MCTDGEPARPSWHAYKYRLSPSSAERLMIELRRVDGRSWRFKLRYNPALDLDEIPEFILGGDRPAQGKTRCLAIKTRMDVMPNGDVVSCKFFPEFAAGNLHQAEVGEVWHGELKPGAGVTLAGEARPDHPSHQDASLSRPRRAVRLPGLHLRADSALADREEIPLGSAVKEGPEKTQGEGQCPAVPGKPYALAGAAHPAQPTSVGLGRILQLWLHRSGRSSDRLSRDRTRPTVPLPAA
jgi:hypothetical protein